MIFKITIDFLDCVKRLFLFRFFYLRPLLYLWNQFSRNYTSPTPTEKPTVILNTAWWCCWPILHTQGPLSTFLYHLGLFVNLLAFSIPTPSPLTYAAAAKSILRYGQLRVLSGLLFPSFLFLVKMMGNFSQDKVVEGQPGECWIVTDIMSFWWTLMSYGVLRGKYITRTSWENIMTGPCNSCLYSWELNVHTSCLLHCTAHIK